MGGVLGTVWGWRQESSPRPGRFAGFLCFSGVPPAERLWQELKLPCDGQVSLGCLENSTKMSLWAAPRCLTQRRQAARGTSFLSFFEDPLALAPTQPRPRSVSCSSVPRTLLSQLPSGAGPSSQRRTLQPPRPCLAPSRRGLACLLRPSGHSSVTPLL